MSTISIGDERATMSDVLIQLHPDDSVAICRRALREGERLTPDFSARQDIPAAHKIAIRSLQEGEPVRKYGQVIGYASRPIVPGDHVHEHNLSIGEVDKDYAFCIDRKPTHFISPAATFNGIVRDDGRIATRNYIGILSTVNCSAHVAEVAARFFEKNPLTGEDPLAAFPNVDGVVALTHKTGCGMSSGEPLQILRRVMAGYATHPNFFRVIVVGLGCEVNQVSTFLDRTGLQDRVVSLSIQSIGGSQKAIEHIVGSVRECLPLANQVKREPVPASALSVALICGGSDGYSGITANPALGAASDLLVRHGGTVILSETPETYGAEHLLTRRAEDEAIGRKLVERMAWWTQYAERENVSLNANPTPGNKAGGITTILEKSLGAMTKSGSTNLREVIEYAQPVTQKGFVFMDAPGFDPVQVTGQIASGANLVAFTTGRGSVFGAKPAPSIKLATNTKMFRHMQDDMDINCGTIVDGTETLEQCGQRIFDLLLHVASGEKSKSEQMDFGKSEFAPWIQGACI
ncbi:altronate dehydratase family protein [Paraburkholderia sp. J10-1]|uniref:UxaA family hydrolase n=1 Tax=Paraburkholderia sp. J10-1 TaxID=2805430 RepID=UPI002AB717DB|nr:altronate dehydratase family protein [Paraburkholderia sp. J10-1]